MGTPVALIEQARDVVPAEVLHPTYFHDRPSGLMILSEQELRKKVEWQRAATRGPSVRPMNWEEWMDVREGWCRYYGAHLCTVVLGDSVTIKLAAQLAAGHGDKYLLLDLLRPIHLP